MNRLLASLALAAACLLAPAAIAQTPISQLPSAGPFNGTEIGVVVQTNGGVASTRSTQVGTALQANLGTSGSSLCLLNALCTWSGLQTFSSGISATSITGLTTPLSQGQGGTGLTVLGTAISASTGTSGHTLGFLDGNNTWSGTNGFSIPIATGSGGSGNALGFASNCYEIEAFGGKGDGTTDNATAFANALAAATGGLKCVRFGPGTFKFASQPATIALTAGQEAMIGGAGAGVTNLLFPAATKGFLVTEADNTSSVHFRDLAFLTQDAAGAANYAIRVNQATNLSGVSTKRSDFVNLTFRGADGLNASDYWNNAIIQNASNFQYHNVFVYGSSTAQGNGISVLGNSSAAIAVVADITDSGFYNTGNGILYGNYFQGMQIKGTNFVGCYTGINEPGGQTANAELAISNSQFDCALDIDLESGMVGTLITSSYFIARGNETAITLKGLYDFSITGNYFENDWATAPTSSVAINVSSWGPGTEGNSAGWGLIDNNVFNAFWNGITLASSSRQVLVGTHNAFDQAQGAQITNANTGGQNCVGTCKLYSLGDPVSFSYTASNLGTGYTAPACYSGHTCDSISGYFYFTTGSNPTGPPGVPVYVNLPAHTNAYNCTITMQNSVDTTYHGLYPTFDTGHLYFNVVNALNANATYFAAYVCAGQ